MSKDLIEERFFTTNRWVTGRECLNLQNINALPPEYSGTLKTWLMELTTFIYLYEKEWTEIYKEYQDIVHKRSIKGNHILHYFRDDEGYLRKCGEQDIFLKITINGNSKEIRKFIKGMNWGKILTFDEYLDYIELGDEERLKYLYKLNQKVNGAISKFDKENGTLTAEVSFASSPDESDFLYHDIFIDPLNETYFIL